MGPGAITDTTSCPCPGCGIVMDCSCVEKAPPACSLTGEVGTNCVFWETVGSCVCGLGSSGKVSGWVAEQAPSNAEAKSPTQANRCSGFLASALNTASSTVTGRLGTRSHKLGGG